MGMFLPCHSFLHKLYFYINLIMHIDKVRRRMI